jgi:IS30 family transposase
MECIAMVRRYGRGFTSAERTELWDRWQRGESLRAIGRAFGKPSSSIYFQLAPHGGIRPAPRHRSRLALTLPEREVISRGIVARRSIRSMARLLGRSPSTVSREVRRNGGRRPMNGPGTEPAGRSDVSWRTADGCDGRWPGSSG